MSDFFDDDPQPEDKTVTLKRSQIRAIEDKAKRFDAAEAEKTALARELAFLKAGIPSDHPVTPYFVKGYDGELTADAIKAAAVVAGLVKPDERDSLPPAEQAALRNMDSAAGGGGSLPNAEAELHAALAGAKNAQEFDAIYRQYGGQMAP